MSEVPQSAGRSFRKILRRLEKSALWLGFGRWQLPNFLVIGAQKAGTTWLHKNLVVHPGIFVPGMKELHYFNSDLKRTTFGYARYFTRAENQVIGEITPAYSILGDDDVRFIKSILPGLKIILFMREPRERAWSQAVMEVATRQDRLAQDVSDDEFIKFLRSERCFERSNYPAMLARWEGIFGRENVRPYFFDHITTHPEELLNDLFQFVGADPVSDWSNYPVRKVVAPIVHSEQLEIHRVDGGFAVDETAPESKESTKTSMPESIRLELDQLFGDVLSQMKERFQNALPNWDIPLA